MLSILVWIAAVLYALAFIVVVAAGTANKDQKPLVNLFTVLMQLYIGAMLFTAAIALGGTS